MGLPSQGRASGAGMRVSSRVKRPRNLPPAVIPIVVVGLAIAAVWGGYSLLEPSGADAGQDQGETASNPEEVVSSSRPRAASRDEAADGGDGALSTGIQSLSSTNTPSRRGLLGEALEGGQNANAGAPSAGAQDDPAGHDDMGPLPEPTTALADASSSRPAITDPMAERPASTLDRPRLSASANAIDDARAMISRNDLVGARELMSRALADPSMGAAGHEALRTELMAVNETLVFGPRIFPDDPMSEEYEIGSGDTLGRIARRRELGVHWKLIQRVNRISRPERIRVGQKIKLVRGPFHAIVDKSDYRADIYHGPPSEPDRWVYITSRPVGLGELGSTPTGSFVVREESKLENPAWVNPRDGREQYDRDDPENPIGEFWIGLRGVGDSSAIEGIGIHGTIEPESIGKQMSMGCVRLLEGDVALMYELLEEGISVVKIVP